MPSAESWDPAFGTSCSSDQKWNLAAQSSLSRLTLTHSAIIARPWLGGKDRPGEECWADNPDLRPPHHRQRQTRYLAAWMFDDGGCARSLFGFRFPRSKQDDRMQALLQRFLLGFPLWKKRTLDREDTHEKLVEFLGEVRLSAHFPNRDTRVRISAVSSSCFVLEAMKKSVSTIGRTYRYIQSLLDLPSHSPSAKCIINSAVHRQQARRRLQTEDYLYHPHLPLNVEFFHPILPASSKFLMLASLWAR